MVTEVYVDGSGGNNSGYGYFVKTTGDSFFQKEPNLTNNQAEYMAIILVLKKFQNITDLIIYSDSKNTVLQLNHEYAINAPHLRKLAQQAWILIPKCPNVQIKWISRKQNIAGRMLGS